MPIVYIGVGSNLGDRHENIQGSGRLLGGAGIDLRRVSPLYEAQALLKEGQPAAPDYLNAVFEAETVHGPAQLLHALEGIERKLGRTSKGGWAPRPIDLDILLYGDAVLKTGRLTIPHPAMASRWFVLKPLADLVPDMIHPVLGKTVRELLETLPPSLRCGGDRVLD